MECTVCVVNKAFTNQICGHSPMCDSCAEAFDSTNYELSLRCPLCRGPALTWPGCSEDAALDRACSIVFGGLDVDMQSFGAAIAAIECGTGETRVLGNAIRGIPINKKDSHAFVRAAKRSIIRGRSPDEGAHAAVQLAVMLTEDDMVVSALQTPKRTEMLRCFCEDFDAGQDVSAAVKDALVLGARTWSGIEQVLAVRALVVFRVTDDILDALIPSLSDNPELLNATMALVRILQRVSDETFTRIAEV